MRVYETKIRPARPETTEKKCVTRACDLCGKKAERGNEWEAAAYTVADTELTMTVECETGQSYPGSNSTEKWEIDLCPTCFVGKLVPWLRSQGAKIEPEDLCY